MTGALGAERTTIETYYEILQSGADRFDPERLRAILAPELVFEGPIAGHRVGAEPFCKGVVGFVSALQHLEMRQLVTTPGKAAPSTTPSYPAAPAASPSSSSSTRG